MLIISTKPVAAIIQAVSPLSILGAAASASAGVTSAALVSTVNVVTRRSVVVLMVPPSCQATEAGRQQREASLRRCPSVVSKRVGVGLAGADAERLADIGDEDLSVADL